MRQRLIAYYRRQRIAGKLNLLLFILLSVIIINGLSVLFSWSVVFSRNEALWTLERFEKQVDQIEVALLRFRLSRDRAHALAAKELLGGALDVLDKLPVELQMDPEVGEEGRVVALVRTFDERFREYLFYFEQTSALESGMRKASGDLLASTQELQVEAGSRRQELLRASLAQSVLRARIIQQEFVLSRDMAWSTQMAGSIKLIVSAAAEMRECSSRIETQIDAYNIGQEALLLGTAFDKLAEYTRKKMSNEESMTRAVMKITERVGSAANRQRESISRQIYLIVSSMVLASLLIVVLGIVLGRRFVRDITSPLTRLVEVSGNIARGNYQQQIGVVSQDEIGELATSFGEMASTVEQQIDALREREQQVRQRTEDLEAANRSLAQAKEAAEALNESLEAKVLARTAELKEVNRQLVELTVTDALTGLANRRHLDAVLLDEWSRTARAGHMLALFMIDVDFFKAYNDHYGHQAGDDCLRSVARVLRESARRAGDLVARYGGEEFVVVAVEMDGAAACDLAEGMRAAVEALALPHALSAVGRVVTVSIGVATIVPDAGMPVDKLLRQADEALYRAKSGGRNRVST